MVTQIDTYFLDIDTLIKSQFEDNVQNNSQVEQKFKEAIILINEIDDENQHKSYKYKYHKTYHSYLTVIGDVEGANRHEKLAKNCEKYLNTHAEERQPILYTDDVVSNTVNQDCYLERKISEELKQIRPILKDELIEIEVVDTLIKEISRVFEKLSNVAKTFEGYQEAIDCEIYMNRLVDSLIHERLIVLKASSNSENGLADKSSKVKNISTELIEHLRCLEAFAHDAAYSKRTEIVSFLSDSSNKIGILFRNVINTEEEINKRARVLCSWFHPDKTKNSKSPYVLRDKHKSQADELFKLVLGFKEHLLNKLKKTLEIEDYEKYGHELWKTAIDYNHAFRGRWNKLKMLKEDNIKELSQESLELNSKIMGELAYHQYRAACKIADKAKLLKIQVKLRGYMALCLYFTNQSLEAPLYALAAILLQVKNSSNFTQQELDDAKNILDKVNSRKEERENSEEGVSSNSTTDIKLENDLNNAMALIRTYDKEISLSNKAFIQNSINKNLINTATKLLVKAERRLVCLEASLNEISNTKQHAKEYKAKGVVVTASGGVVGSAAFLNAGLNFALCGPIGLFAGATCLVVGLCYGYYLFKKGEEMFKEPKIRENLNKIINEALSAYDKEKYQKFIDILSEEYDENKRLLNFHDKVGIVGIDIINTLKTHGFRSDGIAYLLVVLGEVLGSGKINIEGVTHAVLKADAKKLFRMALDEELVKEAEELDKCTSQLRQTNLGSLERYLKSTCGKIKDFVLSEERTRLALEYLQDSQEMPFFSRLEEVRNIAKINIAILNIIEYDDDAYKEAKQTVEEVRKSVKENYQFIIKSKLRLEVLEDFLWVINGEDLSDSNGDLSEPSNTSLLITFNTTMKTDPKLDDKYINYLNNQRSFNQNKYYEAIYFEYLAKKEAKINKLNSLRYWQSAQENYEIARGIDSSNLLYSLGYARCLLKLSKYTQVIKLSDTCPALNSSSEYWHFRSVAYFKQKKYEDAISCNSEALKLDPGNNSAGKHRELIKKLNVNNVVRNRINRYKKELIYETDYLKNSYCDERPVYNILSIDGGGIRGALPALWLSELEYRTRRPIAHLFNMIAGTSTGGIIAAGLSAPQFKPIFMTDERIEYQHSNLIPIFSASDLLNIYRNGSKNLFTKSTSWFKVPIWSKVQNKYTDEGRSTIFKQYFEEVRICHSLTELVIPAANENYTHLFNRYDARKNSRNAMINNTFVDMLMATTAAPTFFPPYKIGNKNFIDGGIHLNNPASTAYSEAIRYNVPDERISVLSLGTGCYLPDPSNPDQYNLLFWAQNLPQFMISAQESNTDREMYTKLKNRYQRWQVFLEEPIELDDHEGINNLLELGYQHIEELDCSDENPINKLVESFDNRPIF